MGLRIDEVWIAAYQDGAIFDFHRDKMDRSDYRIICTIGSHNKKMWFMINEDPKTIGGFNCPHGAVVWLSKYAGGTKEKEGKTVKHSVTGGDRTYTLIFEASWKSN